jgi:ribonuclease T2
MRFLLSLISTLVFLAAAAHAQNFDYYVFALSWSPEFCHENPSNHTPECSSNNQGGFVVHGLWPNLQNGRGPQNCHAAPFVRSDVATGLRDIMPSSIYKHEWEKHGVCSGMTERDYFQKILSLYQNLKIPIRNTGQDQHISPFALRQQFSQSNAGWAVNSFLIQDMSNSLSGVEVCMSRSFTAVACPRPGDTRNAPILVRAKP